jgi:hypothetical protein
MERVQLGDILDAGCSKRLPLLCDLRVKLRTLMTCREKGQRKTSAISSSSRFLTELESSFSSDV